MEGAIVRCFVRVLRYIYKCVVILELDKLCSVAPTYYIPFVRALATKRCVLKIGGVYYTRGTIVG